MQSSLDILVTLIAHTYLNSTTCLLHYFDTPTPSDRFIKTENIPVMVIEGLDYLLQYEALVCTNYLLQSVDDEVPLADVEKWIHSFPHPSHNLRKYIIVLTTEEAFWNYFLIKELYLFRDGLVIFASDKHPEKFDLFTHKYIGPDGNEDPIYLDTWFPINSSFKYGNSLFPDKVTQQNGRNLYISENGMPQGLELRVLSVYTKKFNLSLRIREDIIMLNILSLIGTDFYIDLDFDKRSYSWFDYVNLFPYSWEFAVPIPKIRYEFLKAFKAFQLHVWLLILVVIVTLSGLLYLRRKYISKGYFTYLSIYSYTVCQPAAITQDIADSIALKCIVLILLVFNILLATAYNSRLASVMVVPIYERGLETICDVYDSKKDVLSLGGWPDIPYARQGCIFKAELNEWNFILYTHGNQDFKNYISHENIVIAILITPTEYYAEKEQMIQIRERFKPIAPYLYQYFTTILFHRNSMHTLGFKQTFARTVETGLTQFWTQEEKRNNNNIVFEAMLREPLTKVSDFLNIKHLEGTFCLVAASWGIACLVFMFENLACIFCQIIW